MKTEKQIAADAAQFAERWRGKGSERSDSQPFWLDLLANVFGIETPSNGFITFEEHHMVDASNFIDGHIPSTKVLIEQKSLGVNLRAGIRLPSEDLLHRKPLRRQTFQIVSGADEIIWITQNLQTINKQ